MEPSTHQRISSELCGVPLELRPGFSSVRLKTTPEMRVDSAELVHGGFVFGLADYAAMLAIDHPNVVLGSADVRFLKPVIVGEVLVAEAKVLPSNTPPGEESTTSASKKMLVDVMVFRSDEKVLSGQFLCLVLYQHILS